MLYRVQLMADQPVQARIDYLKDAMRQNPDSAQIKTTLAREYVSNRQFKEARDLYEEALRKQPDMPEALVGSGLVALEMRDLDTAYLRLSTAVVKSPRTTNNLRLYLGQIAEERGQTATALGWYQGVDGDMKDAAQQRMMRLYAREGRPDDALALIRAQPATTPQERVVRAQLEAQVWREAKDYNKAWDALSAELKKQPDSPDLLYDRSLIADLQHNLPAAETDLHRFLQLQPDSVMGLNALGYTLANRTDRLDEANGYLEKKPSPKNRITRLSRIAWAGCAIARGAMTKPKICWAKLLWRCLMPKSARIWRRCCGTTAINRKHAKCWRPRRNSIRPMKA